MGFTMKEEEFFTKYLNHVVEDGKEVQARQEVTRLFEELNTKDKTVAEMKETLLPALLQYVKPAFVEDTKKILLKWFEDKA